MDDRPRLYCLYDLGIKIPKKERDSHNFVFFYQKECFVAESLEKQKIAKNMVADTAKLDEFSLHIRTNHTDPSTEHLSLFFNPAGRQFYSSNAKYRTISHTFDLQTDDWLFHGSDDEDDTMEVDETRNEAQMLYDRLKRAHNKARGKETTTANDLNYLQHEQLRPELRPYQLRAVKWMIDRETKKDSLYIPCRKLIPNKRFFDVTFYMDRFTHRIYDYNPEMREIPAGGLLCDEMGLGKTVEMLSLILHRKRTGFETEIGDFVDDDFRKRFIFNTKEARKNTLHCICNGKSSKEGQIMCNSCKKLQHFSCVMRHTKFRKTFETYQCPDCWKKSGIIVKSKATLIVSPLSIKHQWFSEIQRHIKDESFRLFIYEGVKQSGWIDPKELASYDVVLTDYTVLTSEIYFTKITERNLRRPSRCAKPVSPLPMIKWFRSCLDEAQMVEIPTNQCARMVNSLPAINRWAVTGTPIERHVSTLYGLVYFLGYDPFNNLNVWNYYHQLYAEGNHVPLIKILQKVMWRTCKIDVLDEIAIPPQSEVVHYVDMSDLQRFFYRTEHAKFRQMFNEKAAKLTGELTTTTMSAHTMKVLMEPLRKLRQDCTVPSVLSRTGFDTQQQKKLLTPAQLNDHMIKNTEIELKTCLRTISSSLNGLAACHIMTKNYNLAITSYQSVLKWASDFNDKKIHVDTLLQIHAVHNMLDISKHLLPNENFDKTQYEKKLTELEWKYIETYKNKVKEVEDRLKSVQNDLKQLNATELSDKGDAWWRHVLYDTAGQKQEDTLLEKIILDMKDVGMNFTPQTISAVDFHLTTWIDKVNETRRKIRRSFKDLAYFHANLKPKNKLNEDELFKIEYLVQSAYQCHLFVAQADSDDENLEIRPQPKRTCQLCRTKSELDKYECMIFNKYFFNEFEIRGSWNPCEQEYIFKTLLAFAKRSNFTSDITSNGETELKLIEGLKNEFKEYSQFWVEINYTVSAYDELNMCKSRLEAVDMDDLIDLNTDSRKTNMRIPRNAISLIQQDLQTEKSNAEQSFIRIRGRLKYLEHLKDNTEPDVCPICKQDPTERYAVLQCGHVLCIICVNQMARFQRNKLSCAICRHTQHFKDIFYVTLATNDSRVVGSYSAKIVRIVKEILRIRHDEPQVKIVIFSQWDNILSMISKALETNNVTFVNHTHNSRSINQIEVFKKGSQTCLLLPLAAGSKGLNLTEATHVFLVEPILNPSEELQAIGRVHRIGQTRPTFVHRFIMLDTIEETIYKTVTNDKTGVWKTKSMTVDDLKKLFELQSEESGVLSQDSMDYE